MADLLSNQVAKVQRFADFIDEHVGAVLDLRQMADWGDVEWSTITERLNELRTDGREDTVPQTTRRSIHRTLVNRRREATCDPFESIGVRG